MACFGLNAQDVKRDLMFVYVANESTTPKASLCQHLQRLRNEAIELEQGLVVYLANNETPYISMTNVSDDENKYSGDEKFNQIIDLIQDRISQDISLGNDSERILDLMNYCKMFNIDGKLNCNSLTVDFFIGSSFWAIGGHKRIISRLYFALDISQMLKMGENISFEVYKGSEDSLLYQEGQPFGVMNAGGINDVVGVMDFIED